MKFGTFEAKDQGRPVAERASRIERRVRETDEGKSQLAIPHELQRWVPARRA